MPDVELEGFEVECAGLDLELLVLWSHQAPELAMGLIRGSILILLLAVVLLLSLCHAWGHLDDSPGGTAGLAGDQGMAAVSAAGTPV